jgi:hypothetical protein
MATDTPKVGSIWKHGNGHLYVVLHIANYPGYDRYPLTVVYQDIEGNNVWTRPADEWRPSMTLTATAKQPQQ